MVRTLGFFLDFFHQLISTTGRWDKLPLHLVTMVTMGPVCLMKLTRKWKLVRTLGFFLEFYPQLIAEIAEIACLCTWWPVVTMVTMGPVCLMKLIKKRKLVRTLGFFLDFSSQLILTTGSWDRLPVYLVTMVTMGPVCLMKLTRKWKLVRTLVFFLDFFLQLISTSGSWDRPPVYLVTMGPVALDLWQCAGVLLQYCYVRPSHLWVINGWNLLKFSF